MVLHLRSGNSNLAGTGGVYKKPERYSESVGRINVPLLSVLCIMWWKHFFTRHLFIPKLWRGTKGFFRKEVKNLFEIECLTVGVSMDYASNSCDPDSYCGPDIFGCGPNECSPDTHEWCKPDGPLF